MSYLTNCPPCDANFPILCEPLETTAKGKRLVVEDAAACQKTIQTPTGQQILKTDGAGNLSWTNGANDTVLTKSASGVIEFTTVSNQIPDGSITTDKLAGAAVTTSKLETNSVTTLKIADSAVTEPKIATDAVTESKIATSAVTEPKIANNAVTVSKLGTNEQKQIAKAWVNFDCGTGTVNSSYNVSSITLITPGANWVINFSTPMTDANYVVTLAQNSNTSGAVDGRNCVLAINNGSQTINSVQIYSYNSVSGLNGGATGKIGIAIFGN